MRSTFGQLLALTVVACTSTTDPTPEPEPLEAWAQLASVAPTSTGCDLKVRIRANRDSVTLDYELLLSGPGGHLEATGSFRDQELVAFAYPTQPVDLGIFWRIGRPGEAFTWGGEIRTGGCQP